MKPDTQIYGWLGILLIMLTPFHSLKAQSSDQHLALADTNLYSRNKKIPLKSGDFHPRQLILPASLITVGAIGTAINGMNDFHLFSRSDSDRRIKADDYLEWGMLGWVFVCDLMGKEKNHWVDQAFILALAEGMNAGMVHGLKNTIHQTRPDGAPRSFPSGHTANSFLGAHLAYKEFKDSNKYLAWSGYAIATFVGVSRLYNNRHWLADVIAGAGFGILSVELSYLIYFPVRNAVLRTLKLADTDHLLVSPMVSPQGGGLYLAWRF